MNYLKYLITEKQTSYDYGQEIEDLDMSVTSKDRKMFDKVLYGALDKVIKQNGIDPDGDWTILDVVAKMDRNKAHKLYQNLADRFRYDYSI